MSILRSSKAKNHSPIMVWAGRICLVVGVCWLLWALGVAS